MGEGGSDFEYRIKTVSDVRGFQDAKKAIEQNIDATKRLGQSTAVLETELAKVNRVLESQKGRAAAAAAEMNKAIVAINKAGGDSTGLVAARNATLGGAGLKAPTRLAEAFGSFRNAGGGLAGVGAAVGAAGLAGGPVIAAGLAAAAGAAALGAKAYNEYANAQERVARLNAALAQQGNLTAETSAELQNLAGSLQGLTGIADDAWIDVITRLTQFGADPKQINESVEAVKNLAGILGGDLNAAALMVGKALQDEFTSFSRLGIQFDDHMTKAQKLSKLYEELALRGGGQLEAANDTINGSFRRLRNGANDAVEGFGRLLAEIFPVKETANSLGLVLSKLGNAMNGTIAPSEKLKNAAKKTQEGLSDATQAAKAAADQYERLKGKLDEVNQSLSKHVTLLDQEAQRSENEDDALYNNRLSKIEADQKAGLLSPAQAVFAKERLNEERAQRKTAREAKLRDDKARAIFQASSTATSVAQNAEDEANAAQNAVDEAKKTTEARKRVEEVFDQEIADIERQMIGGGSRELGGGWTPNQLADTVGKKRRERAAALTGFDANNPPKNIAELEQIRREKRETADKIAKEAAQTIEKGSSQMDELRRDRDGAITVDRINADTRRVQRQSNLSEAFVPYDEGGQIAGPRLSSRALAAANSRIRQLEAEIEQIVGLTHVNRAVFMRLEANEREIALLRGQLRNVGGR